jgi:hypothetical protein
MKNIFRLTYIVLFALVTFSCSDDDNETADKGIEVNYANVSGVWQLTDWNGDRLGSDGRYYYIEFVRKAEDGKRSYRIFTNINSFVSQKITGSYELIKDEDYGDIIDGTYDYTLSTDNGWEFSYVVKSLTDTSMEWVGVDAEDQVRTYTRVDAIPTDILSGSRVSKQ